MAADMEDGDHHRLRRVDMVSDSFNFLAAAVALVLTFRSFSMIMPRFMEANISLRCGPATKFFWALQYL